jgi:hypothetical protein
MKTILYLHGLDSMPDEDKIKAIEKEFNTQRVFAPYIDYRKEPDTIFDYLLNFAKCNKPDLIIGSSMGGYVGYYIAKLIGCEVLLFNPALCKRSVDVKADKTGTMKVKGMAVLGIYDTVVNPEDTRLFLKENEQSITILMADMEHRVPLETFVNLIKL